MAECCLSGCSYTITIECQLCGSCSSFWTLLASKGRDSVGKRKYNSLAQLELLAAIKKVRRRVNLVTSLPEVLGSKMLRSLIYLFGDEYFSCGWFLNFIMTSWSKSFFFNREKVPVHKVGNTPLDMNQFRMLFSTCKVPGITRDSIMNYFRTGK